MKDVEKTLQRVSPKGLSADEKSMLWSRIETNLEAESFMKAHTRGRGIKVVAVSTIVALLFGGGATVAFADNSRPGDFLFPVDVALEKVQLNLASEEEKDNLRIAFAQERLEEVRSLVAEITPEPVLALAQTDSTESAPESMMMTMESAPMSDFADSADEMMADVIEEVEEDIEQSIEESVEALEDVDPELLDRANKAFVIALDYLEETETDSDDAKDEIKYFITELRLVAERHIDRYDDDRRILVIEQRGKAQEKRSVSSMEHVKARIEEVIVGDGTVETTSFVSVDSGGIILEIDDIDDAIDLLERLSELDIEKEFDFASLERALIDLEEMEL